MDKTAKAVRFYDTWLKKVMAKERAELVERMRRLARELEDAASKIESGGHVASRGYVSRNADTVEIDALAASISAREEDYSFLKGVVPDEKEVA